MIYDIRLVTVSSYERDVPFARHVLRLTPRDLPGQQVVRKFSLEVAPGSSAVLPGRDFFGNEATNIVCLEPHREFVARAMARVEVTTTPWTGPSPPWEEVAAAALNVNDLAAGAPAHFLFPSRMVAITDPIRTYAEASFPPGRPLRDCVVDFMKRLHADMTYDGEATTVSTLPEEAFALRRGVCQDYAHIMISGLRALGLPAKYVSGFIRTLPPPGQPRREGANSMHAWVSAWGGSEAGWFAVDPTNALVVADEHVVVAMGRDYADVAPLDGVIVTSGAQRAVDVAVDMAPVAA